jgi:hypothetical protein
MSLREEIRGKQAELERLKEEETALARLSGSFGAVAVSAKPARHGRRTGGRVDWSGILHLGIFECVNLRGSRPLDSIISAPSAQASTDLDTCSGALV